MLPQRTATPHFCRPVNGGTVRLSRPRATVCEFPAHRNYAVTQVSATGFEPVTARSRIVGHHYSAESYLMLLRNLTTMLEKHKLAYSESKVGPLAEYAKLAFPNVIAKMTVLTAVTNHMYNNEKPSIVPCSRRGRTTTVNAIRWQQLRSEDM